MRGAVNVPRLVAFLIVFGIFWAGTYLKLAYVGHSYAADPACERQHFPACQPIVTGGSPAAQPSPRQLR